MLLPLLGGCAPAAIASVPASIIKFKRPECTRLHLRELQSQKFSPRTMCPKLPRKVRRRFAVLIGAIALILPLYTVTMGPLYHKILRPPLIGVNVLHTKKTLRNHRKHNVIPAKKFCSYMQHFCTLFSTNC